jgi:LysR family hydrogen peroxide-inducible transcriptional activator
MLFTTHPVSVRQLQYVVAVAETLSFRRAAERCFVSQPSLSAQVAEVESALGVQLFERDRRRVLLTPAGEAVVARARTVLVAVEDLVTAARGHLDPLAGTLRLGVIPTIGPYLLPDLDPALRRAFPKLTLRWTEDKTESLVAAVETGELDAALVALEAELGDLEHAVVGEDAFVLATATSDDLRGPVRLADLGGRDVLLLDDGHCFRDQALELCTRAGAAELGFRATSLTTLVQMVAGGGSATLLPAMAVDVENRRGRLRISAFAAPAPKRTLGLVWRRRSPLAEPLRRVAAAARLAYEAMTSDAAPSAPQPSAARAARTPSP